MYMLWGPSVDPADAANAVGQYVSGVSVLRAQDAARFGIIKPTLWLGMEGKGAAFLLQ
jgi:hypothetical protein